LDDLTQAGAVASWRLSPADGDLTVSVELDRSEAMREVERR